MATVTANRMGPEDQGSRRGLLTNVGRGAAVLVGVVAGVAVLVAGGFLALVTDCTGATENASSTLCTRFGGLEEPLEWTLVGAGCLIPILGGIATCFTSRPRWLVAGLLAGAVLFALVLAVAGLQASALN